MQKNANGAEAFVIDDVLFKGIREKITLPDDWQRCYDRIKEMRDPSILEYFIKLYYWFDYVADGQRVYKENLSVLSELLQKLTGCANTVANECVKRFLEVYEVICAVTSDKYTPAVGATTEERLRIHTVFVNDLRKVLAEGPFSEYEKDIVVVAVAVLFPNLSDDDFSFLMCDVLGEMKPISAF